MLSHKEQIGRLDRRITFQSKVIGTNTSNEDEERGWVNIATNPTVYASVDDYRGSEQFVADKMNEFQTSVFVIRYRDDIKVTMRILFDGLAYNIHSIEKVGRKRYLKLAAESGYEYQETVPTGSFGDSYSPDYDV